MDEKLKKYPKTRNYEVVDTIGVPHPYCITPKHIVWASDHYSGILDKFAIEQAEKNGAKCGVKGCTLKYHEHQQGLVVKCMVDDKDDLQAYLLSIKDMTEKDGYAGFVLLKGW